MKEIILELDSLEKIEKFSKGEAPYLRSPELMNSGAILNGLFVDGKRIRIVDLITSVKNKTISDEFGNIPVFENPTRPLKNVFVEDVFNRNLGYLGYPCLKANFSIFGRQVVSKYPVIRIPALVDDGGYIVDFEATLPLNPNKKPSDKLENTFIPFEDTEIIEKYEIPSKLDEILAVSIPDYSDPECLPKPKKVYKFFANDQDWGTLNLNTKLVKPVTIKNTGEAKLVLSKYRMGNEADTHFKVLNLNTPVTIEPGATFSFDVEYSSGGESEVSHTNEIIYAVYEDEPFVNPVFQEKVISKLTGKSGEKDLIDTVEDDLGDWLKGDDNGTYVVKTISRIVDKSAPIQKWETRGLWKCEGEKLNTFFTGSNGITNDAHYLSVYNKERGTKNSFHQFDISFGHKDGLGSRYIVNGMDTKPSRVMYRKYLQECYYSDASSVNTKPTKFNFKNGVNGDYVYFIQLDNDDFKDMLDPGNFEICLSPLSGSSNQLINTGSNVQVSQTATSFYTLIDDSWDTKQKQTDEKSITDWYYITSGSLRDGVYAEENDNAWGVVFPKMGLIVLDGVVLDQSCSFNTVTASIDGQNSQKLFLSISGSSAITNARNHTGSFFARSAERKIVETYFCRVGQGEFNYSTNPTYVGGEFGELKYTYFKDNPHSYITTIGLYNKFGDLLAVGKVKNPVLNNNHKSLIFQVRLRLN